MPRRSDPDFMRRAIELARRGAGHTRPNPDVGAVVVRNGRVIGEGWHRRAGGAHAEVAALGAAGSDARGATLYVTLEPCSRPGRVGACTDAIIAAGIVRVVYGATDPNPVNRGKARRLLARAGIACERLDRSLPEAKACEDLIADFRKLVLTGLPFVTVKLAMSLDGRIADNHGDARWISSSAARRETGKLRERVDAIMVGAETIRRDDPSLLSHARRNDDLIRVVITKSGRLPKNAQIFTDGAPNKTLVFRDSPCNVLEKLGQMGVKHVLCEGGLKLATALADAGLVDRWIAVLAPTVIGSRPIAKALRGRVAPLGFPTIGGDVFTQVDFHVSDSPSAR